MRSFSYVKFGDHATSLPSNVRFATNGVFNESIQYKYDSMGNIIEVFENGRTACRYEYDALGRLTREDNVAFGKTTTWGYDNNGNIIAKYEYTLTTKPTSELHLLDCTCVNYAYDDNSDQLMSYNGEAFVYDTIGNPTTYRGKTATWAYGRQLTSFDGNNFTYDARGRRTAKNDITFTYDSNGNLIKQSNGLEFLYDHTGVFAVKYNGATYFYRKDTQANIVALLDNNGNVVVKYKYDAWGNCVVDASTTNTELAILNPFRYRSYYFDTETGFYFLKTRYYDPVIGRFMTIDDLSYLDPKSINGLNLYTYCGNNPVMRLDPAGHEWWNPFSWNWNGIFNTIGKTFSQAGQWIYNNILKPVGSFFADNWDIIVGVGLIAVAVGISIITFGSGAPISGLIIGAVTGGIIGSAFGALGAAVSGGNILHGAWTGLIVGAFGGISGLAAATSAAGMSLINDRVNGKTAGVDSLLRAGISGLTAGTFAGAGNVFSKVVNQEITELCVKSVSNTLFSFIFSTHNFVADAIINKFSLW